MAGKASVVVSARARIVRMEGTPKARHYSLRPIAGWLRIADGLELPMPIKFGSARPITVQAYARCKTVGPIVTDQSGRTARQEVASAGSSADCSCTEKQQSASGN